MRELQIPKQITYGEWKTTILYNCRLINRRVLLIHGHLLKSKQVLAGEPTKIPIQN